MALRGHHRQYTRHSVDLDVTIAIAEESATQVTPINGLKLRAQLLDLSGGGARLVLPTYLPRATAVDLELPALGGVSAQKLGGQVVMTRMIDREPRFSVGVRFAGDHGEVVDAIAAAIGSTPAEDEPVRPVASVEELPAQAPAWMSALYQADLIDAQTLTQVLADANGNAQAAAEAVVETGLVSPRDLSIAQAEGYGLPFVEPGEYRLCSNNRALMREELARAHVAFPLFAQERIVTLAVSQPLELAVLDQVRLQTGCEVDQCLVNQRELQHLIEWAYGGFQDTGKDSDRPVDAMWTEIMNEVSDAPVVRLVEVLLSRAIATRASDVHIDAEESSLRVRFRVDGVLREVPAPPKSLLPALVSRVKILSQLDIAETRKPQDGHFKFAADQTEIDIRVSTLPAANGEALVLRLLRSGARLLSLEELGMESSSLGTFDQLIHLPHGMLLVTGPTGSGKTTTLYSALSRLDRVRQSMITLEDPVEVRIPQVRQVSINPKAGLTFEAGLRAILRQDPDCIMLGEIRDRETAEIALQAALTGHIVLSTLHTNSAAAATTRLLDMGVPDFLVASSLVGVLAQRLCRRLCSNCAKPVTRPPEGLEAVVERFFADTPHMQATGCKRCGHTGYEGRVGVFELLVVTRDIRRAILDQRDDSTIARVACSEGMQSLLEDGIEKVRRGMTSLEELVRVVGHLNHIGTAGGRSAQDQDHRQPANAGFDVEGYEHLLSQWLKKPAAKSTAEPAGVS